ncbi:hypothetical protein [Rhodospirillaceae bacterium SYSU D60014]|uniref:hypothetical protein n=1 Tax=Virgifigura deserti TaxID=2268457 RepID=UPI000E66B7E1
MTSPFEWLKFLIPPSDDDREISLLFFEWTALKQESDDLQRRFAREGVDYDSDEAGARYDRMKQIEDAILAMQPKTMAGVWVFVRMAWEETWQDYAPDWCEGSPKDVGDLYKSDLFALYAASHATRVLGIERRAKCRGVA